MPNDPDPLRLWRWRVDQAEVALREAIPKAENLHRRRERLLDNLQRLKRLQADYQTQLAALQRNAHAPSDAMALQAAVAQVGQLLARAEREQESTEGACRVADQAVLKAAQHSEQAKQLLQRFALRLNAAERKLEQRQMDQLATQRAAVRHVQGAQDAQEAQDAPHTPHHRPPAEAWRLPGRATLTSG